MLEYDERASKSDLYRRVKLAPVNAIQRAVAINALRDADAISNGIMWVVTAIGRLLNRANANVGRLTHNH